MPLINGFGMPMSDPISGEALMMNTGFETVSDTETVYDDPDVAVIDLFDFFIDPYASDIENARFCGHREYMTRSELESRAETADWKISFDDLSPESVIDNGAARRLSEEGRSPEISSAYSYSDSGAKGLYLVHHYWEDNRYAVIINKKQLVFDGENPFWHGKKPYDSCRYVALKGEFYGIGVADILSSLQDELNTTRNQRIDYNSMAMRRMWKVRNGSGLTARDLIWRQNGIIPVNELDDVTEIQVQPLPASAFANEEVIKADMRDATGCHDILMGLSRVDETATTTMTKDNNASIRFKTVISAMERDLLIPLAEKIISLDRQFMSGEKFARLADDDGGEAVSVSPDDLEGDFDLLYVGTSMEPMANKELNKGRLMQALNVITNDPAYQNESTARFNLYRQIFKALEIKDPEELIPAAPPPPTPPEAGASLSPAGEAPPLSPPAATESAPPANPASAGAALPVEPIMGPGLSLPGRMFG
jgi:hypothetical protein